MYRNIYRDIKVCKNSDTLKECCKFPPMVNGRWARLDLHSHCIPVSLGPGRGLPVGAVGAPQFADGLRTCHRH